MQMPPFSPLLLLMAWGLPAAPPQQTGIRAAQPQAEERTLSNSKLRVHLRPNLPPPPGGGPRHASHLGIRPMGEQRGPGPSPWEARRDRHGEPERRRPKEDRHASCGEWRRFSDLPFRLPLADGAGARRPRPRRSSVVGVADSALEGQSRTYAPHPGDWTGWSAIGGPMERPPQIGQCTQSRAILSAAPGPRR
jgi:hypothetical protein